MQNQEYNDGSIVREQITLKGFAELLEKLTKTFATLKIDEHQTGHLYDNLKEYTYRQLKAAIRTIVNDNETIRGGTNLIRVIRQSIPKYQSDDKPIGWICRDCNAIVPLENSLCKCMTDKKLTLDEKREGIAILRGLVCNAMADSLQKTIEDEIPF